MPVLMEVEMVRVAKRLAIVAIATVLAAPALASGGYTTQKPNADRSGGYTTQKPNADRSGGYTTQKPNADRSGGYTTQKPNIS